MLQNGCGEQESVEKVNQDMQAKLQCKWLAIEGVQNFAFSLVIWCFHIHSVDHGGSKPLLLEFQVKTASDAHILLAPCFQCDGYEINLGAWRDTASIIRSAKQKQTVAVIRVGCLSI